MTKATERRKKQQAGQEIIEFALVSIFLIPMLLGSFVVGINIIKNIQANQVVRDLDNIYIHGGDFSTYPLQQLSQRLAPGLNLQMPAFSTGTNNVQANTGSSGDGIVWVSQVMYIGATTDPNCVSVGAGNCTNHDNFVFTQRIVFGNSSLNSAHPSMLADPVEKDNSHNAEFTDAMMHQPDWEFAGKFQIGVIHQAEVWVFVRKK